MLLSRVGTRFSKWNFFGLLQNPDPEEASRVVQRLEDPEAVVLAYAEEETLENTSVKSCLNAAV